MKYLQTFKRRVLPCGFVACCWLGSAAQVWAQEAERDGGRGASPWVFPYALVILAIGLGLLIICKPSGRREKAKVEQ
jgi:apolipoprotein N-acyltransferase